MEINDQNLAQLRALFLQTLNPDNAIRKESEKYLDSIEIQPGFSIVLLHMVSLLSASSSPEDMAIRQSSSVLFKNFVKRRWAPPEDEENVKSMAVPVSDREAIKNHLVDLMSTTPTDVQKQLAEAVAIISKHDFPDKWTGLLPQLVDKIPSGDISVIKGVMLTVNSIMKRYRYSQKSDSLYAEIIFCLNSFQIPLLEAFKNNSSRIDTLATDKVQLTVALETQRLMARIFFSLNWQDIPEYFEDNIAIWMTEFGRFLSYKNPLLVNANESDESGPIEKLQVAIVENLNLYATKYEDEFTPYLGHFTKIIWQLLLEIGDQPKFDILATSSIKFLTSVCSKQMNVPLFTDEVLREIIEHIVVKNLTATEADEELFEDNPTDYIRKDMEGTDQDTRRRSASELVRGLLKFFNVKISQLCVTYIGAMLEQYRATMDWRAKDAALHLVLAVAVMSTSANMGAGELNPNVNILEIFSSHVLPEVHDNDVNARPIVKADSIKMICVFRSHLQAPFLLALLPHVIRHLMSSHAVIQVYACLCIERFLTVKDRDAATGVMVQRITKEHLKEHLQPLFSGLFKVLDNENLTENDYAMKCIMRVLSVVGPDIAPVTQLVLHHLTSALERVCKNPINPHFNHYLFECLAVLIRSCCSTPESASAACPQFEALLFPPFQSVLSLDVIEFTPYVFQILAQLLSARPGKQSGLSPPYRALFPPLLSPILWERKGNVPALTDLFRAYIGTGMEEIISGNHLPAMLGVFQKLLASKVTDVYAFKLLDSLISNNQLATLSTYMTTIWSLLLHRMQEQMKESKTPRYCRLFLHSFSLFAAMYGGPALFDALSALEEGLLDMVVTQIWSHNRASCASADPLEVKEMVIGGTRILCETAVSQNPEAFGSLLKSIIALVDKSTTESHEDVEGFDEEGDNREFDSAYSKLAYAVVIDVNPTEDIPSGPQYFATTLCALSRSRPRSYGPLVQSALDEKEGIALQSLLTKFGLTIE